MSQPIHEFVRDALARGIPRGEIRAALAHARWREEEIDAALAAWDDAAFPIPVPRRRAQLSAREAFQYLLMFATLYTVAWAAGSILFAWIERTFLDAAMRGAMWDGHRQWVRSAVASLAIAFPVFLFTARMIGDALEREPELRHSGVRRWLTYLTLFNAACVIIGDLIAVLMGLLSGELTTRFLLKAIVVLAIAAVVFVHYLGGLRREETDAPRATRRAPLLPRIAGVLVVAVAVLGFTIAGSPARVRVEVIDRQRIRDLESLAEAVRNHREQYRGLPATLTETDPFKFGGAGTQGDPVTRKAYEYRVVDSLRFELCATFDAPDSLGPYSDIAAPFWRHGAGAHCFEFKVPPTLRYPAR